MIFHIADRSNWDKAQAAGLYSPPSLEAEGFIHCSRLDQVLAVANDFYREQSDLLLLCIDERKLGAELRWEAPVHPQQNAANTIGCDERFPHLYGPLNLNAVAAAVVFEKADDGFVLPLIPPRR